MRSLVNALDEKHQKSMASLHTFGKVTPIFSENQAVYRGLSREIVKIDNEKSGITVENSQS